MADPTSSDVHVDTVSGARTPRLESLVACPSCHRHYPTSTYASCPTCGTPASEATPVAKALDVAVARWELLASSVDHDLMVKVDGAPVDPAEAYERLLVLTDTFGPEITGWIEANGEHRWGETFEKHDAATRRALHALARARRANLHRIANGQPPMVDGHEVSLEEFNRQHDEHLSATEARSRLAKSKMIGCTACGEEYGTGYASCPGCMEKAAFNPEVPNVATLAKVLDLPGIIPSAYLVAKARSFGRLDLIPDSWEDVDPAFTKAVGFASSSPSKKFRPDPRLHSHPFVSDPNNKARCRDCGMGSGVHSRMVYKPGEVDPNDPVAVLDSLQADEDETPAAPARKGLGGRLRDTWRDLTTPYSVLDDLPTPDPDHVGYALTKSADPLVAKRYTFGPMYLPDRLDAHKEWAAAEDLQEATWDYVRKSGADRTIYLQHSDVPAGEWVEVVSWPMEAQVEMVVPNTVTKAARLTTLPANTVYMGIIWNDWAWEYVEKGEVTGLSMGGLARRILAAPLEPS